MSSEHSDGTTPSAGPSEEAAKKQAEGRALGGAFAAWRGRLLDLTGRNRALNYRPTKVSSLTIVNEKPAEVYRLLVVQEKPFTFSAVLVAAHAG